MTSCVLAFNGERLDPVSETYHLGNGYRAYSPVLMRFTSPDSWSPFGAGGINSYAYCAGDPVNRADPSGHMSWQAGLGIGLGILGILGAVFTGGASIAAAGSISAALAGASTVSLGVGTAALVADVTGIASAATEESNPKASAALGWTSLAMGVISLGVGFLGAFRGLKTSRMAGTSPDWALSDSESPKITYEHSTEEFVIYSGNRKPGEVKKAVLTAHGRKMPEGYRFNKVTVPEGMMLNYYTKEGYTLRVAKDTNQIPELASGHATPVDWISGGRRATNYSLALAEHSSFNLDLNAAAIEYGVDIITPPGNGLELTYGDLFRQLDNQGIRYKVIEAGHCRAPWEGAKENAWMMLDVRLRREI